MGTSAIKVNDTLNLLTDQDMELWRFRRALPLLQKYGDICINGPFPEGTGCPQLPPTTRCYDAAFEAARDHDLDYWEGFLLFKLPDGESAIMAHGWCCVKETKVVVDPTMHRCQGAKEIMYFGVPIKKEYQQAWSDSVGYYGVLDGVPSGDAVGVYLDPPEKWLDKTI